MSGVTKVQARIESSPPWSTSFKKLCERSPTFAHNPLGLSLNGILEEINFRRFKNFIPGKKRNLLKQNIVTSQHPAFYFADDVIEGNSRLMRNEIEPVG